VASLEVVIHKTYTYFTKLDRLFIPSFTKIIVTSLLKMQSAGFTIVIMVILTAIKLNYGYHLPLTVAHKKSYDNDKRNNDNICTTNTFIVITNKT
jgi:hypothetical protein